MKSLYITIGSLLVSLSIFAQTLGDYGNLDNGNWSGNIWALYSFDGFDETSGSPNPHKVTFIGHGDIAPNTTVSLNVNFTIESDGEIAVQDGSTFIINSGVTLTVKGKLTVFDGTLTNNGTIIVESTDTESGSLIYDGTLGGTCIYRQEITNGVWHLIGVPMDEVQLSAFKPAEPALGYMREYITGSNEWGPYMSDEGDDVEYMKGYEYWTTADHTVSVSGTFGNGTKTYNLATGGDKWNLISNPYPCAVDIGTLTTTNIDGGSFYYYIGGTTTNYGIWNSLDEGVNGGTQFIPPFQGFFVLQTGGSNTLVIENGNKAHPDREFYKSSSIIGKSDVLRLQIIQDEEKHSESLILMYADATNGHDTKYDARALYSSNPENPELFTEADDILLKINALGTFPAIVPLVLNIAEAGNVKLSISETRLMNANTEIKLEDRLTGNFYKLDSTFSGLSFNVEPGYLRERFFVHYSNAVGIDEQLNAKPEIYSSRNTVYIKNSVSEEYDYQIINMLGQVIMEGQHNGSDIYSIQLDQPSAYYLVKVISDKITTTEKLYISK